MHNSLRQNSGKDFGTRRVRAKFQTADIQVHVTGFAKIVGDLIAGLKEVLLFFAVAIAIATATVFWYTRCARSTLLVVLASLIAVVWQLGLLHTLGYDLDPVVSIYSVDTRHAASR